MSLIIALLFIFPYQQRKYLFYLGTEQDAFNRIFHAELQFGKKNNELLRKIRQKLHSSFESINVTLLPPRQNLRDLDPNHNSTEFQKCAAMLKEEIIKKTSQPRKLSGNAVNSRNVDSLLNHFVKQLENGDNISVKSAVTQYQRDEIDKAKQKFEERLEDDYTEIDLPVKDGLKDELTDAREALLDHFTVNTSHIDLEVEYKNEVYEHLKNFARKKIDDMMEKNQLLIDKEINEQKAILMEEAEAFQSEVKRLIRNTEMESTQMQQYFDEEMNRLVDIFKKNTAQLDFIPKQVETKLDSMRRWAENEFNKRVKVTRQSERFRGM